MNEERKIDLACETKETVKLKEVQDFLIQAASAADNELIQNDSAATALLRPGAVVHGRYEILESLGAGGVGAVYKARDKDTDQLVAIKLLHLDKSKDSKYIERFRKEVSTSMSLHNKNIVRVLAFGDDTSLGPYLTMELIDGKPLSECLEECKDRAKEITSQVCQALEYAHGRGVIHRDIKPSNILIQPDGTVKVVDFGIAKVYQPEQSAHVPLTQTSDILGTPMYMSPEQCFGHEADACTDVYQLGCLLYELLSGKPPFAGRNQFETMYKHVSDTADLSAFDPPVQELLKKALSKSPHDRYQSVSKFHQELLSPPTGAFRNRSKGGWRKQVLGVAAGVLVLLIANTIWSTFYPVQPRTSQEWESLGSTLDLKKEYKRAEEAYLKAIALDPNNSSAEYRYSMLLSEQDRLAEAESHAKRTQALSPTSAGSWMLLGYVLDREDKLKEAEFAYRESVRLDPKNSDCWEDLAGLLDRMGHEKEAAEAATHVVVPKD